MPSELQPYVGPRPFEREERQRFFGRESESSELLSRVIAHPAVLLYSQSGAGKTSLLNASLIPLLEKEGFEILPTARVRGLAPKDIPAADISNLYVFNVLISWTGGTADPQSLAKMSIADYLNSEDRPIGREGMPAPRIAVFDQFEELFTFYPERWNERQNFFEQVSEALERDRLMRIIFVMREDYIAELDPYVSALPEKLRTRFRLERLREDAALEAVKEPLDGTGYSYAPRVAEQLVNNLLEVPVETAAGVSTVVGEFVEPVQLQVVCQTLWQKLDHSDSKEITLDQLKAFGDVDLALSHFYETAIVTVIRETGVNEGLLRRWFEHTLITTSRTRGTVFRGRQETGGIPNAAVDKLVDQHLIRGEVRGGARWYELTHDRLIEPIITSNQQWMLQRSGAEQTRQRLEKRAADWVRNGRPNSGLLDEAELLEARRWLESPNADDVGYSEALFALVQASRAAVEEASHERERLLFAEQQRRAEAEHALVEDQQRHIEAQKQASRRLRRLAAALAVMFLLAIATAVYGFNRSRLATSETQRAQQKEREATAALADVKKQKDLASQFAALANEEKVAADKQRLLAQAAQKEAEKQAKLAAAQKTAAEKNAAAVTEVARLKELETKRLAREAKEKALEDRARELNRDGRDFESAGSLSEAITKYEASEEKYREMGDLSEVSNALLNQARVYGRQQKYGQAEEKYEAALKFREEVEGVEGEGVATILNYLGVLYHNQDKYKDAEPLYRRALAIRKAKLAADDPYLVQSYRNLANLLWAQNKYEEAEPIYRQILTIREKSSDPNSADLALSLTDLGGLYFSRGKYTEAEPLYKRALTIYEAAKGDAALAQALLRLAGLYTEWGKFAEAEPLVLRALAIQDKAINRTPADPDIKYTDLATTINSLALIYYYQNKYAQAEPLYKRALDINKSIRGSDNAVVATYLHNLGLLYFIVGRYKDAEEYELNAKAIHKRLAVDNGDEATTDTVLARLYQALARYSEAERLHAQALDAVGRFSGKDHPDYAINLHYHAQFYVAVGRYSEAKELEMKAIDIFEKKSGPTYWRTSVSYTTLATVNVGQKNYAEAERLFKQALENLEKPSVLGPDHPEVANTLNGLARLYLIQDRLAEAEPLLKRSLAIREQVFGAGHPDVGANLNDYGVLYLKLSKYGEAEQYFKRALAVRENQLGLQHPSVAETLENYSALLRKTNRENEASQMEERAKAIRAKYPQVGVR